MTIGNGERGEIRAAPSRNAPPRLLEQLRDALMVRHRSPRTVAAYVAWSRRYIRFNGLRHPAHLGLAEVEAFLSHLAVNERVSASTQSQALAALLFLYDKVLGEKLPEVNAHRARRPVRLPTVMSREEVQELLSKLDEPCLLMASLLYGSGLRLSECVTLRVKDVDFATRQLFVRRARGKRTVQRCCRLRWWSACRRSWLR